MRGEVAMVDGGAPFYDVDECSDGQYVSIGSIEGPLDDDLLRLTGLEDDPDRSDVSR